MSAEQPPTDPHHATTPTAADNAPPAESASVPAPPRPGLPISWRPLLLAIGVGLIAGWTAVQQLGTTWPTPRERTTLAAAFAQPSTADAQVDAGLGNAPLGRWWLQRVVLRFPQQLNVHRFLTAIAHLGAVSAGWFLVVTLLDRARGEHTESARWIALGVVSVWAFFPPVFGLALTVDTQLLVLGTLSLFAGTAAYAGQRGEQRADWRWLAAAGGLLLLGQLLQPSPGWLLVLLAIEFGTRAGVAWRRLPIGVVACGVGFFFLATAPSGGPVPIAAGMTADAPGAVTAADAALGQHALFWWTTSMPVTVAPAYPFAPWLSAGAVAAGAVLVGLAVLLAVLCWRQRAGVALPGIALILVPVVDGLYKPVAPWWLVANAGAYVGVFGLLIVVAGGVRRALQVSRPAAGKWIGGAAGTLAAVLTLGGVWYDSAVAAVWRAPLEHVSRTTLTNPTSPAGWLYQSVNLRDVVQRQVPEETAAQQTGLVELAQAARESARRAGALLQEQSAEAWPAGWYLLRCQQSAWLLLELDLPDVALATVDAGLQAAEENVMLLQLRLLALRAGNDPRRPGVPPAERTALLREAFETALALERVAEPGTHFAAQRAIEFGDLLLHRLNQPEAAIERFTRALESDELTRQERLIARVGLALAEIRGGQGARGRDLLLEVLDQVPGYGAALLALGEYHLRSDQWEEAEARYRQVVRAVPTHTRALRGLHEALVHQGRYAAAADVWAAALQQEGEHPDWRPMLVWSAALAGEPEAERMASQLLEERPGNALARLARGLVAVREGAFVAALDEVEAVHEHGGAVADDLVRAARMMERLGEADALPDDALVLAAEIWNTLGRPERVRAALEGVAGSALSPAAQRVRGRLLAPPRPGNPPGGTETPPANGESDPDSR